MHSTAEAMNLFEREEALAKEASDFLDQGEADAVRGMLQRLLQGYESLLHESKQLIRIADRRELDLNRLNRELEALSRSLAFQAEHDALTGALNKAAIGAALARTLELGNCCLMVVDIDHFKRVNDSFGHLAGDQVLKGVAERLKVNLSDSDLLGRFGGEEFFVLGGQDSLRLAQVQAERLRAAVAEEAFDRGDGQTLEVTISVGLACSQSGESADDLVRRADAALYQAKQGGRNRVEVSR